MTDFITEIRNIKNLKNAIAGSVELSRSRAGVTLTLITDTSYNENDFKEAKVILRKYVPKIFTCNLEIAKLVPDCEMVKTKITEIIKDNFQAVYVTLSDADIEVNKGESAFYFKIKILQSVPYTGLCEFVTEKLKKQFCGDFFGKCEISDKSVKDLQIEEEHENAEFEIPTRKFDIAEFKFLEGTEKRSTAVYLSDLNFVSDNVVICGRIEDIRERAYTNSRGQEIILVSY